MPSGTESGFPSPERITEAEWRLLLTAVAGPLRAVSGDIKGNIAVGVTGAPVRVAVNSSRKDPAYVRVQLTGAPFFGFFGRSSGVSPANGIAHAFAAEPVFEQVLMPNEELYLLNTGAASFVSALVVVV